MTIERVKSAMHAQPFRPFTIVMGDGTRYRVTHPEMIAFNPKSERTIIVAYGIEEHAVLDLFLLTALEFGNGNATRRRSA